MLASVVEKRVREIWEERKSVPFAPVPGLTGGTGVEGKAWTLAQVEQVLDGARSWLTADELGQKLSLSRAELFDVVAAVGGRLGRARLQSNGSFARVSARRAKVPAGIYRMNDRPTVVLPAGWTRSREESRDISRSFVAVVTLPREAVMRRAEEWLREEQTAPELSYFHFAQLRAVSRGDLPALSDLQLGNAEMGAYVKAFRLLRDAVTEAGEDLFAFVTTSQVGAENLSSFAWLLPGEIRERVKKEGPSAVVKMRVAGEILANPARVFPRNLAEIDQRPFWDLTAQLGFSHEKDSAEHSGSAPFAHLETAWRRAIEEHGREVYEELGLNPSFI